VTDIREGNIVHCFPSDWIASKYDDWPYYRAHFEKAFTGCKAVDLVAQDPQGTLWLVELKDYRVHQRTKPGHVVDEVSVKVRDSLAGILGASKWHSGHAHLDAARKHVLAKRIRVVFHIEQPKEHSRLFPRIGDLANLQQKLKQQVNAVDPHPLVVDLDHSLSVPWTVRSVSGASR
jgi:hypothetical protein